MCRKQFYGRLSIWLAFTALIIGAIAITKMNIVLAICYIIFLCVAPFAIAYFYCRKCPSIHGECPHGIFGKIAAKYRPAGNSDYTKADIIATLLIIIVLIAMAQFALVHYIWMFIVYWALMVTAGAIIMVNLCPNCDNGKCPICIKLKKEKN